jgi:uridine kinase
MPSGGSSGSDRGDRAGSATVGHVPVETYADLAREILARPPRLGGTRLVAVDGPSGAGKTAFAGRLAAALGGAPVMHTDHLLDGWDDQLTFWARLEKWVLAPLRAGRPGAYRRYSWVRQAFLPRWHPIPAAPVVILEGVSAARAAIRPELTYAVFVTAPPELCLARALRRDGERLRPYLETWQRGERRHFAADATAAHADLVVDGTAPDPAAGYRRLNGA